MFVFLAAMPIEKTYLACGLFGASIFIIRMVLMLAGAGDSDADVGDVDADLSGDMDADFDDVDVDHGESDASDADVDIGLHILTVQGLMAFVMMFGFTGYAISTGSGLGGVITMLASTGVGVFTMWLVARLMLLMKSLQSSGTVSLDSAVGEEGSVYLTISAGGVGKVSVKVGHNLKVVDAVCEDKQQEIRTGERVSVAYTMDGRTLVVNKV